MGDNAVIPGGKRNPKGPFKWEIEGGLITEEEGPL